MQAAQSADTMVAPWAASRLIRARAWALVGLGGGVEGGVGALEVESVTVVNGFQRLRGTIAIDMVRVEPAM